MKPRENKEVEKCSGVGFTLTIYLTEAHRVTARETPARPPRKNS